MKFFLILCSLLALPSFGAAKELVVYSAYDGDRLAPIFKPFTDRTGISVKVVFGPSQEIIEKLKQEGESSPADLHLDKDIVFHGEAQRLGLYRPFSSEKVAGNIPAQLLETNKNWFLIFYRARVIMFNSQKVSPSELSTYEALGEDKWRGRLCLRTSGHSYNQALAAYLTNARGPEIALQALNGWAANLAYAPNGGDTDLIKSIAAGNCDVGIANTYYLAPMIKADPAFPVRPFFPNQDSSGAHINGVGVGITKSSKNVKEATLLLEYLSSKEVQAPVAAAFFQYPANPEAAMVPELVEFGPFFKDPSNVGEVAAKVPAAKEVISGSDYK